jgi:tetratricopeptide (TPR) repeat protein
MNTRTLAPTTLHKVHSAILLSSCWGVQRAVAINGKFYKVFIASPGGLANERKAFRDALNEYNDCDAVHRSAVFLPIGWELTLPGVGRPQALINADIETCDYFLLILWDRWGSPTEPGMKPSYSSGIEEEYHVALKCFEDPSKPMRQIVILFKSVEERQLSDPGAQLGKVLEFKKQLEDEKRLLFDTFDNVESLKQKVHRSLSGWLRDHEKGSLGKITDTRIASPIFDQTDSGSFDLGSKIGQPSRLETERERKLAQEAAIGTPKALIRYAETLRLRGRGAQALPLLEKALNQDIQPADRAWALRELGRNSDRVGDFQKAERLYIESIKILESLPDSALSLSVSFLDLHGTYINAGKYGQAEESVDAAIKLREKLDAKGGPAVRLAFALQSRASLLLEESRYSEAMVSVEKALEIRRRYSESDDTGYAEVLRGRIEVAFGNYTNANEIFVYTLAEWRSKGLETELPTVMAPLALLRRRQGKYLEAKELAQGALIMNERNHGPESQSVAAALDSLGMILRCLREFTDSEVAYRRCLLIRERFLGTEHPRFASGLFGIGRLYFDQDGLSEADGLFRRARNIIERVFGADAIQVADCDMELCRVYIRTQRFREADQAIRSCLEIMTLRLRLAHPNIIRALRLHAQVLRQLGQDAEALEVEKRATEGEAGMDKTAVIDAC